MVTIKLMVILLYQYYISMRGIKELMGRLLRGYSGAIMGLLGELLGGVKLIVYSYLLQLNLYN